MKLLIATGNAGKLREIQDIINASAANLDLEITSLQGLKIEEPEEPHSTYMENAKHKAQYYAEQTGLPTLSEDSGMMLAGLEGFPGVRTKEFTEEAGGLTSAMALLADRLQDNADKTASFICAAAIYFPDQKKFVTFEGKCAGKYTYPPRGEDCFGYDPVYIPEGYNKTMAELGMEIKNKIGHRGKAIRGVMNELQTYLYEQAQTKKTELKQEPKS